MPESTLILRTARPEEAGRLHAVYSAWNHDHVLPRPEEDLRSAAERGLFFLVEDNGRVLATAGAFDLREGAYVEVGGTYVDDEIGGLGLQTLFFQLRIAAVVLNQGPAIRVTTAIDPGNAKSLRNCNRNGFVPMASIPEQTGAACKGCRKLASLEAPRICCCDFFELPVDAARAVVRNLLERIVDGKTRLQRDDRIIELEVQCRIVTDAESREALQAFVDGQTW